ncbi:MAG: nicotinate phosphoribosyltransferase [Natrialbaceae archaeon]|nr:nicotinate phosphoribosyltransferase [Natrialbaceae archaeon]
MDRDSFGHVTPETLGLFTDLYELRMMQGYLARSIRRRRPSAASSAPCRPTGATWSRPAWSRCWHSSTPSRSGDRALAYLRELGFEEFFLEYLADFSFSGEIRAVPEGTPVFPDEPLLEVTAPLPEGQLLETIVLNQLGFQTLIATKARRMRDIVNREGDGQTLADFGTRRAHGTDAGVKAARAAYLGGFDGTSNVAAGELFDIPTIGTMAHAWVQSFPSERAAFEAFVDEYGAETILLVDTYDTLEGTRLALEVTEDRGVDIRGIRLDSGDLVDLSKAVEEIAPDLATFVSSGLDEYAIKDFLDAGGIASGFGPGTALTTSADAPSLDIVYKLVAVEEDGSLEPSMKLSTGKVTYPGQKDLRRQRSGERYTGDQIGTRGESLPGESLLEAVVENGARAHTGSSLETARTRALESVRRLPKACRAIETPDPYPVEISATLAAETEAVQAELESSRR